MEDHVEVPDFNQNLQAEQHFTQLPNTDVAPVQKDSQGLPKPVLLAIGIVTILLLTGGGMWIYTKNKVKSTKTAKKITPVAEVTLTPKVSPKVAKPSSTPFPTLRTLPTLVLSPNVTPTTKMVSGTPNNQLLTPTVSSQQKGGVLLSVTPTTIMASSTATVVPTTTLPRAGSFQTSLVLIVVSITLIYLALLL